MEELDRRNQDKDEQIYSPTSTDRNNRVDNNRVDNLPRNYLKDERTLDEITSLIQTRHIALSTDPIFVQLLDDMQLGNWQAVTIGVQQLQGQYPNSEDLKMLAREVALRSEFDEQWSDKVRGRSFVFSPIKLAVRILPIALILTMLGGSFYYVQQTRQINAITGARQAKVDQAKEYLLAGQYKDAIALFEELLHNSPENEIAKKGLAEAKRQLVLQTQYGSGLASFEAKDLSAALTTFSAIIEKAPGYRDVNSRLEQIQLSLSAEEMFESAEAAFEQRDWTMAIELYENLRSLNGEFKAETVNKNLTTSYLNAGLAIVSLSPAQGADLEQAQSYFRKVLKLDQNEPTAKLNNAILTEYERGTRALAAQEYPRAMQIMERLNSENPGYLNGYITQQLYQLYLDAAIRAEETNDLVTAHSYYQKAATLNIADRSLALQKLQIASIALTPTATPTWTPPPTLTPSPTPTYTATPRPIPPTPILLPTAISPSSLSSRPAPTVTSVPLTMASLRGWILFSSNRDGGSGLFVMQPNGAGVQAAPAEAREQLNVLYDNEKWSPDRNAQLLINREKSGGGSQHNIYKFRHDLPENWTRKFRMTDFPGATYDPVWDPTNSRIAFVSNHTGGDEIWVMGTEGQDHTQLTKNGWEWDKHPTWSLDGQQLFFYSNRSGLRQIWVMNSDGSSQRQISDGQYDDWDPVVIR